jgi:hypothetical protein
LLADRPAELVALLDHTELLQDLLRTVLQVVGGAVQ